MFSICKSHRSYSQLNSVYNRLKSLRIQINYVRNESHFIYKSKPSVKSFKSRINRFLKCIPFSTEAKEEKILTFEDQLNASNNLILFCPKWDQMYDVYYSGAQPQNQQQLRDQISDNTAKESSDDVLNKDIHLLNTCEEWKPIESLNSQSLLKYYTQLSKLRLTGILIKS